VTVNDEERRIWKKALDAWSVARYIPLFARIDKNHGKHQDGHLISGDSIRVSPKYKSSRGFITQLRVRVRITLRLAVYRQSVHLGVKPLETHDQ
jgi:hypothetical protein